MFFSETLARNNHFHYSNINDRRFVQSIDSVEQVLFLFSRSRERSRIEKFTFDRISNVIFSIRDLMKWMQPSRQENIYLNRVGIVSKKHTFQTDVILMSMWCTDHTRNNSRRLCSLRIMTRYPQTVVVLMQRGSLWRAIILIIIGIFG